MTMADPHKYDREKLIASYLFSLALFALAGSIIYFTIEVAAVRQHIPEVLVSIDNTTEKIEPIVDEVSEIVLLVPPILQEIEATRKLIPPVLKEVKLTREQVPAVLAEIEATRKQVPFILAEVKQVRKQVPAVLDEVAAVRKEIPAILQSTDKASNAVLVISKEISKTRKSVPPMMDRADILIEKARVAGKEASQGAVTGIFKGIITAPFVLIGDAGRSIAGISKEEAKAYNERDFDLIEQASLSLLNSGSSGDVREWENAKSGNYGVIKLLRIDEDDFSGNECRTLNVRLINNDDEVNEVTRTMCRNDDDQWAIEE